MAESPTARLNILQGLEDLTECSIHCGTYENPRQLPCLHSFCLQCLVNYMKDKPQASNITCPLCRKETAVPDDGIEGFPRNFFIDKVIEIKRLTGPLQKDTLCDICQEDEDLTSDVVPVASTYCAECRKNHCDRCTKEHRRHNKSHTVLKMGSEEINEQLVKKLEVSFCNDHSGKAVEMFCFDCQSVICMIGFAEKHKLHNCSDINKAAKDFRKQMELEISKISVCLSEGQKSKEMMDKKKDDFLQEIKSAEKKIFERSEELRRIIDRDRNLLLDELKVIKSSHLKEMQIKDEEIQKQLTIIASLKTYGNEIIAVGSASDICGSVNQFSARTKELQTTLEEALFCYVIYRHVSFRSMEFQENLDRNILGRLDVHCEKHLAKDLSDPDRSSWKTLTESPGSKGATWAGEGKLTDEHVTMTNKPIRVRKLKSQTPGGDASMEADAQIGLAEGRVDEVRVLVEKTKTLDENDDEVIIEVDRDRHHYLMSYFEDEMKKHLPPFRAYAVEGGMLKVAFALKSKKNGAAEMISIYNSYLSRFHFEVIRLPAGVDGSVLHSLVASYMEKLSLSFVFDEDSRICKLIGNKKEVDKIKKLIEAHVSEQLKTTKDTEDGWVVPTSKKKGKKMASIIYFSMDHGKLNRCESSQAPATKKCSLQVNLYEYKTKAPATDAIVRAIDSKMQGFGDAKAAIEFESGKNYKDECRKIMNAYHNSIPFGEVVHTMTSDNDTQQKLKIKFIVHVVLEEKKVFESPVVRMKDVIYRCLNYADNKLQIKSISFPHLGGSDYCDIGSFARGSVEALQSFASTAHHLQRVCFVVKDSKTLHELADEFETSIDHHQHNLQFTSSSESSGKDHTTNL